MHIHFIYPRWQKLLDDHPELGTSLSGYDIGSFRMVGNGIAQAAAALPAGTTVTLCDQNVAIVEDDLRPDLVGIGFFTPQASEAYAIADRYRARGVPVIAGGIHPTMMVDDTLRHVDAVVCGPIEGLWPRILTDLRGGRLQPVYHGVDSAPFAQPRRELFSGGDYLRCGVVQVSRGCHYRCPFCVVPSCYGTEVVRRPIDEVLADIASLPFPSFFLGDENLLFPDSADRRYREELLRRLIEAGNRRVILAASYPRFIERLDDVAIANLRAAGCRQIYLVTGLMEPLTAELGRHALRERVLALKAAEIEMLATFTLGHDRDPPDPTAAIMDYCTATDTNLAEFTISVPFPGTDEYARLDRAGRLLTRDWRRYNAAQVVFQPLHQDPADLQALYLRLWQRFFAPVDRFDINTRYLRGFGRGIFATGR